MVGCITAAKEAPILEPSAGEGVFLDALYEAGFSNYIGVEIDLRLQQKSNHKVEHASFVSWKPSEKYAGIIGNPPYIRWKHLEPELQLELKRHHLWGKLFNPLSDYLSVFIANSIEHLMPRGELVFITPSFWMHTLHSAPLRDWILTQGVVTEIIDFGEAKVFDGVSSAIVIFKFVKDSAQSTISYWKYIGGRKVSADVELDSQKHFQSLTIPSFQPGKHWTLADAKTQSVVEEVEKVAMRTSDEYLFDIPQIARLGDYVSIANGMVSGLDKAFRFDHAEDFKLTADEQKCLMKVAKAKDLDSLRPKAFSAYIDIPVGLSEKEVQIRYPNFVTQLMPYKKQLLSRYSYGRELPIWEWAFRRSEKFLVSNTPKIFVPCKERMTNRRTARFALVDGGIVATQDVTALAPLDTTRESIEYILAYLSTIQVSEWIRVRGLMKGGIAEFSEKPLSDIPFRFIDWNDPIEVEFHNRITEEVSAYLKSTMNSEEFINAISKEFKDFN
nr:Eco57I restriction-modification methylase domain-containing protein [Canibacter zhuwentaonis]